MLSRYRYKQPYVSITLLKSVHIHSAKKKKKARLLKQSDKRNAAYNTSKNNMNNSAKNWEEWN